MRFTLTSCIWYQAHCRLWAYIWSCRCQTLVSTWTAFQLITYLFHFHDNHTNLRLFRPIQPWNQVKFWHMYVTHSYIWKGMRHHNAHHIDAHRVMHTFWYSVYALQMFIRSIFLSQHNKICSFHHRPVIINYNKDIVLYINWNLVFYSFHIF